MLTTTRSILASIIALALAISFVGTTEQSASAFQVFQGPAGQKFKWDMATVQNIRWEVAPEAPAVVRESMLAVTAEWTKASGERVTFVEGSGGVRVEWNTTGASDPTTLAHTTFAADGQCHIKNATIVINAVNYEWVRQGFGAAVKGGKMKGNLDGVLLHELGHALGMDHSDKVPEMVEGVVRLNDPPTMNSVLYPGAETLHLDDETGIISLYGEEGAVVAEEEAAIAVSASPAKGVAPLNVFLTQTGGDKNAAWDFGDGASASGLDTTHRFTTPGVYTVTVISNGKKGTMTIEVEKKGKKAKAPKKQKPAKK